RGNHVAIQGTVRLARSGTGGDRPFQLRFTVPVDGMGWRWGDYARRERVITPGATYAYLTTSSEQQTSRYPFGELSGDRVGLALGIPLSDPRIFRVSYDPSTGLSIEFDLGISGNATALG